MAKNIPNGHMKYIPNGHRIYICNILFYSKSEEKFTQIGIFGFKVYRLATLVGKHFKRCFSTGS
jgi:hypothetical protein